MYRKQTACTMASVIAMPLPFFFSLSLLWRCFFFNAIEHSFGANHTQNISVFNWCWTPSVLIINLLLNSIYMFAQRCQPIILLDNSFFVLSIAAGSLSNCAINLYQQNWQLDKQFHCIESKSAHTNIKFDSSHKTVINIFFSIFVNKFIESKKVTKDSVLLSFTYSIIFFYSNSLNTFLRPLRTVWSAWYMFGICIVSINLFMCRMPFWFAIEICISNGLKRR